MAAKKPLDTRQRAFSFQDGFYIPTGHGVTISGMNQETYKKPIEITFQQLEGWFADGDYQILLDNLDQRHVPYSLLSEYDSDNRETRWTVLIGAICPNDDLQSKCQASYPQTIVITYTDEKASGVAALASDKIDDFLIGKSFRGGSDGDRVYFGWL